MAVRSRVLQTLSLWQFLSTNASVWLWSHVWLTWFPSWCSQHCINLVQMTVTCCLNALMLTVSVRRTRQLTASPFFRADVGWSVTWCWATQPVIYMATAVTWVKWAEMREKSERGGRGGGGRGYYLCPPPLTKINEHFSIWMKLCWSHIWDLPAISMGWNSIGSPSMSAVQGNVSAQGRPFGLVLCPIHYSYQGSFSHCCLECTSNSSQNLGRLKKITLSWAK